MKELTNSQLYGIIKTVKGKEKEMEELKQKYQEIKNIADRVEELRLELFQNKEHRECVMDDESEFEYVDDKMFSLQSQLRDLAEFCLIGVID